MTTSKFVFIGTPNYEGASYLMLTNIKPMKYEFKIRRFWGSIVMGEKDFDKFKEILSQFGSLEEIEKTE